MATLLAVSRLPFFLGYLTEVVATGGPHSYVVALGAKKSLGGWGATFLKGVGANWLVCMSLFMAISSDATIGKLVALWWPVFSFIVMGFDHSIANMFFIPMALMEQTRDLEAKFTFGDFIAFNLIPATLGNIVGGSFFMAFLEWILYRDHFAGKVETIQPVPGAQRDNKEKVRLGNSGSSKMGTSGGVQVVVATPGSPLAHALAQHISSPGSQYPVHKLGNQSSFPGGYAPVPLQQPVLPTVPDGAVALEMEPPKI